jgi:flavin reductase (DIM6/NTAB) family NADH-FMN oxidoreductase RutF
MDRKQITFNDLVSLAHLWSEYWMVLTSGDFAAERLNAMAIGWGSLGMMWGKPFVQVVVRPDRYTFEFMEQYDSFTVSTFSDDFGAAVEILGTQSGRDGDKIAVAGLTPVASSVVAAPCFAEAELVVECRKIYWQDMDPSHFLDPEINAIYPEKDYHRIYFGEILAITAVESFPI